MPCGWEGNRRYGVALAMRHGLQWFTHLQVHGLRQGDEHPAYIPHRVRYTLPYRTALLYVYLFTSRLSSIFNHLQSKQIKTFLSCSVSVRYLCYIQVMPSEM